MTIASMALLTGFLAARPGQSSAAPATTLARDAPPSADPGWLTADERAELPQAAPGDGADLDTGTDAAPDVLS